MSKSSEEKLVTAPTGPKCFTVSNLYKILFSSQLVNRTSTSTHLRTQHYTHDGAHTTWTSVKYFISEKLSANIPRFFLTIAQIEIQAIKNTLDSTAGTRTALTLETPCKYSE